MNVSQLAEKITLAHYQLVCVTGSVRGAPRVCIFVSSFVQVLRANRA